MLHEFQEEAMKRLTETNKKKEFNGLLVLPTGAGKTMTATYWLLKNATDKRKKVLWIAHRHLLLEQAAETFVINSYKKASDGSDFLANRISYKYIFFNRNAASGKRCGYRGNTKVLCLFGGRAGIYPDR